MNKSIVTMAGQIMTLVILVVFIAKASIRLNAMEEKTMQVSINSQMIRVVITYLRLQDPELYERAERLAK